MNQSERSKQIDKLRNMLRIAQRRVRVARRDAAENEALAATLTAELSHLEQMQAVERVLVNDFNEVEIASAFEVMR